MAAMRKQMLEGTDLTTARVWCAAMLCSRWKMSSGDMMYDIISSDSDVFTVFKYTQHVCLMLSILHGACVMARHAFENPPARVLELNLPHASYDSARNIL